MKFQLNLLCGSGEKVNLIGLAVFSNGGHF